MSETYNQKEEYRRLGLNGHGRKTLPIIATIEYLPKERKSRAGVIYLTYKKVIKYK